MGIERKKRNARVDAMTEMNMNSVTRTVAMAPASAKNATDRITQREIEMKNTIGRKLSSENTAKNVDVIGDIWKEAVQYSSAGRPYDSSNLTEYSRTAWALLSK